jgi:hypothetical protein
MQVAERQSTGRPSSLPADPLRSRYADVRGTPVRRAGSLCRPGQDHLQVQQIIPVLPESIATLPPFGPLEGHKWFSKISSQWESQKNRFAFFSFAKIQFLPLYIWDRLFMSYSLGVLLWFFSGSAHLCLVGWSMVCMETLDQAFSKEIFLAPAPLIVQKLYIILRLDIWQFFSVCILNNWWM